MLHFSYICLGQNETYGKGRGASLMLMYDRGSTQPDVTNFALCKKKKCEVCEYFMKDQISMFHIINYTEEERHTIS